MLENIEVLYHSSIRINKEKIILPDDIVIVTNEENPKIKRTIGRSMYFFKDYLLKELKQRNLTYKHIKHLAIARNRQKITELKDLLHNLEKEGKIYYQNNLFEKWPDSLALTILKTGDNNKLYFELDGKRYYKEGKELNNALEGDIIAVSKKGKHIVKIIERTKEELILEVVEIDGIKQLEPILLPGKGKIKVRISSTDMKRINVGDRIKVRMSLDKTDGVYEADYINTIGNIKDNNIDIGILCVRKHCVQQMTDILVDAGIKGIWNFSAIDIDVPDDVKVESVNFSNSLFTLSYLMNDKYTNQKS